MHYLSMRRILLWAVFKSFLQQTFVHQKNIGTWNKNNSIQQSLLTEWNNGLFINYKGFDWSSPNVAEKGNRYHVTKHTSIGCTFHHRRIYLCFPHWHFGFKFRVFCFFFFTICTNYQHKNMNNNTKKRKSKKKMHLTVEHCEYYI